VTSAPGRFLIIKLRAIGDVLLSTAVIRNLRTAFPSARIDFLTERASRQVVEGNTDLDEVLVFDPSSQNGLALMSRVRRRRYDLVIDLFGNPRSALVTLASGAKRRVGYRFNWRTYCYNVRITPRGGEVHNLEFNLDALRGIDVPVTHTEVTFPVAQNDDEFAARLFRDADLDGRFVVSLNTGGGWESKRWGIEKFAELGDAIASEYGARIVVVWGPGERPNAVRLSELMKAPSVLIPETDLKQLAAILRRCTAMVTNDSGPMHIAAAMGVPLVAIFGPTNPEFQGPVGTRHEIVQNNGIVCLGCNFTRCPIGNPCMKDLGVGDVLASFRRLMPVASHAMLDHS
jgi:lipopolysaccharide heptosyltransferase II